MRRLPIWIVVLAVSTGLAADNPPTTELLQLEGTELVTAADAADHSPEEHYSAAELTKIAARLADERKKLKGQDDVDFVFGRFFEAACSKATSEELDELINIYVQLEPGSFRKLSSLRPLAAAWIRRELRSIEPAVIELPKLEPVPDAEMRDASPELIAAWKLFRRATDSFDRQFRGRDENGIGFQENEAAFYHLIDDVLRRRGEKLSERLSQFRWSGSCGTGSEMLAEPSSLGMFMALLHERRMAEAVGAAVRLSTERALSPGKNKESLRISFLKSCGLDWEAIFAGALLNSGGYFHYDPYVEELAASGSDRAALFLSELTLRSNPHQRDRYIYALASFFPRGESAVYSTLEADRVSAQVLSDDTRKKVVEMLVSLARTDTTSQVAEPLVSALERTKMPEAKAALHLLLKHPSGDVASQAASALRGLGEAVEAPTAQSVRFQISVNGKPLAPETLVHYGLLAEGTVPRFASSAATDAAGAVEIPWDKFARKDGALTAIQLEGSMLSPDGGFSRDAACFSVRHPVPKNPGVTEQVDVTVVPVRLEVGAFQKVAQAGALKAQIRIRQQQDRDDTSWFRIEERFTAVLPGTIAFAIQKGVYDLDILGPGIEHYKNVLEVTGRELRFYPSLKPGSDLHVEVVRPDGDRNVRVDLIRNGKKLAHDELNFDYGSNTYRGLAVGDYTLHIHGANGVDGPGREDTPLNPYAGKDVTFAVSGETPLIDLGEIHLDPLDKE